MKSKTDILAELEDKLCKNFTINNLQWGRDDCGTLIEVFVLRKQASKLRSELAATWYGYTTIVIGVDPPERFVV